MRPHTARIAVVDDEPSVARLIARLLKMHGFEVWVEPDCKAVLKALQADADCVDLLITDQTMPGMTGGELVTAARALAPQLPVMLVTGYSAEMSMQEVETWGNSAYMTKPLDLPHLLREVRGLLSAVQQPAAAPRDAAIAR